MIDPVPRTLPQTYPAEGRTGTALPGWKGILVGLPLVSMGLFIALFVAPRRSARDAPREVIAVAGAVFVAAGAIFVIASARTLLRARRRARRLAIRPAEPWYADFGWDRRGVAGDAGRQARSAFGAIAGIGTFLALFGALAFGYLDEARAGKGVWLMRGGVVLFAMILAVALADALRLLARRLKYGRCFLRFGRFPFLLGESADLRLEPPRAWRDLRELHVALRCVEERIEERRDRRGRHIYVARWQLWADARSVAPAELAGGGLSLSFELPADARLGTELSSTPPRYWELSVTGEAEGVDYASTFLVPVYASPGSAGWSAKS